MSLSGSLTKLTIKDDEIPYEQAEREGTSESGSGHTSPLLSAPSEGKPTSGSVKESTQKYTHINKEEPCTAVELASHAKEEPAVVSPSLYQYCSLPSSLAIRLIELLPGEDSDPICCSLSTVNLEDAPLFEALSYVWGNPRNRLPIFCFDHGSTDPKMSALQVTVNCWHALRRLRLEGQTRVVWIDAICINQNDNDERAQQVGLMGDLYRKAACVLVYLGHDQEQWQISTAFKILRDIAIKAASFPTGVQPSAFTGLSHAKRLSFLKFFELPWFKRCWTLQEIGLARRAILVCDGDEMEWDVFFSVIRWIDKYQLIDKIHFTLRLPIHDLATSVNLYTAFEKEETGDFASPPDFLDILMSTRNREATDPKDRIFAFLGHPTAVGEQGPLVVPFYTQKDWIVFYKFALTYLKRTQNLRLLSAVDHGEKLPPGGFPLTWIPWWHPSQYLCNFGMSPTLYGASAGANESQTIRLGGKSLEDLDIDQVLENSTLKEWEDLIMSYSASDRSIMFEIDDFISNIAMRQVSMYFDLGIRGFSAIDYSMDHFETLFHPEEAKLSVKGLILDQVRLIWPVLDREDVTMRSFSDEKDPKKHVVELLCNYLEGDDSRCRYEDSLLALSLTLVAGRHGSKPAKEDLDGHRARFAAYRNGIQTNRGIVSKPKQEFPDHLLDVQKKWPGVIWKEVTDKTVSGWQQFMIDAANACHNRKFFTTTSGFFGLGPGAMPEIEGSNDLYCAILLGASVPFILQKCSDTKNGDSYRLVGEAYVHGIMNGEAIEMWKRGVLEEVDIQIY